MSKGLEALKEFIDDVNECINSGGVHCVNHKNIEIIKKELKDYEEMKHSFNIITCENGDLLRYKKALEIIKALPDKYKEGLIYILLNALNERKLTQEEYELLKEVLL